MDTLFEGLSIARSINEKWLLALCLFTLSVYERSLGKLSDARQKLEESLRLIDLIGDHQIRPDVLEGLGEVAEIECDYQHALQYYKESLALVTDVGDADGIVNIPIDIGRVYQISGDRASAAQFFNMALQASLQYGSKIGLIHALEGLGTVAQARGDSHRAILLFQASASLFDNLSQRLFDDLNLSAWSEKFFLDARAQVGNESFSTLTKEGQAMTLEQAVQYALEETKEG